MVFGNTSANSASLPRSEAQRGDIRNSPFAGRAKEYSWALCRKFAPRNITPTDIDYTVECNGCFLFFEMKNEGASMTRGQEIYYERLLYALDGKGMLAIVTHESSENPVVMPDAVKRFDLWWMAEGDIERKHFIGTDKFVELYQRFFAWAEGKTK